MTDDPVHIAARAFGLWEKYRAECWMTAELDSDWRHVVSVAFEAFNDEAAVEFIKGNRAKFYFDATRLLFDNDEDAVIPELKVEIYCDVEATPWREVGEVYFNTAPEPER